MIDRALESTFYIKFTTRAFVTSIPTTLLGSPVLSVLEEDNATPITDGVSVSVDRASVDGLNEATIVATTANGYESGKSYALYISTGTVDSVSVVGEVVGEFSIDLLAAQVWDRVLTGSTHNVPTSAGRRLRTLGSNAIFDGTASAGSADSITITGGSATDGIYIGTGITIQAGTGAGQSRYIVSYDGSTKIAEVARAWTTAPSSDSEFVITPDHQIDFIDMGVAQGGGNNSITLASTASSTDDLYTGTMVRIMAGTGDGQVRIITAYNGTSNVATITPAWVTNPSSDSAYATLNTGLANIASVINDPVQASSSKDTNWGGTP